MIFLFVWVLSILNGCLCENTTSENIENVYIDTLIQRYLSVEKYLWDYIYASGNKYGSPNINEMKAHIRSKHNDITSDEHFQYILSQKYKSKFIKYIDFNNILGEHYAQTDLTRSNSDSYTTLEMALGGYDYTSLTSIFEAIERDSENTTCLQWSAEIRSGAQNLFMFYEILSASILVSYLKSQRSNMIAVVDNRFEEHDFETLRTGFNAIYNETITAAIKYVGRANRLTWMCDKNITGDSLEITNFLRGYVDNEINLNSDGSCWNTCSDYKFTKSYRCELGTFCDEQMKTSDENSRGNVKCNGSVFDCSYIDERMLICPSVSNKNRRYDYINYRCTLLDRINERTCNEDGTHFGRGVVDCETTPTKVSSFKNSLLSKCDYCFCYCDEQHIHSDRYFSLQPVVTDVEDNMIVSGVQLAKRNGIFSWTITQSKLGSQGLVEQYSYNKNRFYIFNDFKINDYGIEEGRDYHKLSWQNRSINLDIITLPPGRVVTGLRFVANQEYLSLQVRSTKFNFMTGQLQNEHEWTSGFNRGERTNLELFRPEPPRYFDKYLAYMSVPDFSINKFIKFRPSDPEKDVAQSTVPFIDAQMVRPENLTPFSGIGVYYKGKPGLGGYIAPAVVVYDMSPYIGNRASSVQ